MGWQGSLVCTQVLAGSCVHRLTLGVSLVNHTYQKWIAPLVFANSALSDEHLSLRDTYLGWDITESFSLRPSIGHWAADAELAVFFFIAVLELKKEYVSGQLRNPGKAAVPVLAAMGAPCLRSSSCSLMRAARLRR